MRDVSTFSVPIRIYWEDTDAGGVVYHAAYVCFLERARTEWLRVLGVEQQAWREQEDVVFVVRDMRLGFLAPARLDDLLNVTVTVQSVAHASVVFAQKVVREGDARVLIDATVKVACISASRFRPRALPESLRQRFNEFLPDTINEVE